MSALRYIGRTCWYSQFSTKRQIPLARAGFSDPPPVPASVSQFHFGSPDPPAYCTTRPFDRCPRGSLRRGREVITWALHRFFGPSSFPNTTTYPRVG
eukprot:762091-Hanusia_phi.AAC.4